MNNEVVSTGYFQDIRNIWRGYDVFFHKGGGMITNKMGLVIARFDGFVVTEGFPLDTGEHLKVAKTKGILAREKSRREKIEPNTRKLVYGAVIHKTETDNLIDYAKTLFDLDINYAETEPDLDAWGYSPNTKEIYVVEGPFELNGFLDPNDFLEKVLELHPNSKGVDKLIQIEEHKILMLAEDYKHDIDRDVEVDYVLEATDKFFNGVKELKEKIKVLQERKKEMEELESEEDEEANESEGFTRDE